MIVEYWSFGSFLQSVRSGSRLLGRCSPPERNRLRYPSETPISRAVKPGVASFFGPPTEDLQSAYLPFQGGFLAPRRTVSKGPFQPYYGRVSEGGQRKSVQELEVERLPPREESGPGAAGSRETTFAARVRAAFDPVAAGLLVDVLDALTRGALAPLGLLLGVPLGYFLGRRAGLTPRRSLLLGLGLGIYCVIPITTVIPLGTLTWIYLRFWRD